MKRTTFVLLLSLCALPLFAALERGQGVARPWDVVVVDMNHDGLDDVIDMNRVKLNAGGGAFGDGGTLAGLPGRPHLSAAHFNGGGIVDFLSFRRSYPTGPSTAPARPDVSLGPSAP